MICLAKLLLTQALLLVTPLCATERPNILFIFCDDLTNQARSCLGDSRKLLGKSNIDRLAAQGMKFWPCLVPKTICDPSRATVLTGRYSHMNGFYSNVAGRPFDGAQQTFPELPQKAGYQTALIGKWHLLSDPTDFDHWLILPGQDNSYNPPMIRDGKKVKHEGCVTGLITEFSIEWPSKLNKSKPFLLMSQHKAPQREWAPTLRHLGLDNDRVYPEPETLFDTYDGSRGLTRRDQEMTMEKSFTDHDAKPVAPPSLTQKQRKLWDACHEPRNVSFRVANPSGKVPFDAPGQPQGEGNSQWKIMKSSHRTSIARRLLQPLPCILRPIRVRFHDLCVGLMLLILSVSANGQPAQFFVATNGNDSWSGILTEPNAGSTDGPFASLERARDAIRSKKKASQLRAGGTVQIREGNYELKATFNLDATDSGSENAPIIYQSYKDETVTLRGGPAIRGFQPVSDPAMAKRLPREAQGKVRSVDLKAAGVTDFGELASRGNHLELFFNGKPMQMARWPNQGFVKIGEVLGNKPVVMNGIKGDRSGILTYTGDRPERWVNEPEGLLHGYWFWDWSDAYQEIDSIDTRKQVLKLKPPFHNFGYRPGQHYYALNLLTELDQPGEWYLDRAVGRLYFWPPGPLDNGEAVLSVLSTLIRLRDTSWLAFRGLNLEATRGTAIVIEGGNHDRISNCTIRNTGSWAVRVEGGTDHGIEGCHIYQLGDGGISLQGGDRMTLIPARHYAANNHIHDFGRLYRTYRPAVALGGVGQAAAHNHIHDGPHNAIQFGGNDHLIEFNEVHHVCLETGDVGAFYTGRDWTARGTLIRCNYFHHIERPGPHGAMSVYLDDAASGITILGNLFYKAGRAMFIGGGRDNLVENNIFVDCTSSVHLDARGLGWMKFRVAADGDLPKRLAAMPYKKPPWSNRYPELRNILRDEPGAPKGNHVVRNISVGGEWLDIEKGAKPLVTLKDNLVDQDPRFVDRAGGNFQLRKDSPAFKLGFKPIPLEKIGPGTPWSFPR